MYFKTNSGPYWTPELSLKLATLFDEFDGICEAFNNLVNQASARAHHTMLAPLAHILYLHGVPIIRKKHGEDAVEAFHEKLLPILLKSRFFPEETTEHQVSWSNWDRR